MFRPPPCFDNTSAGSVVWKIMLKYFLPSISNDFQPGRLCWSLTTGEGGKIQYLAVNCFLFAIKTPWYKPLFAINPKTIKLCNPEFVVRQFHLYWYIGL